MKKRVLTGMVIFIISALFVASRLLTRYFFDAFVLGISFMACHEMIKTYETDTRRCSKMYIYLSFSYVYVTYIAYFLAKTFMQAIIYQMLLFAVFFMMSFIGEIIYLNNEAQKAEENGLQPNELLLSTKRTMTLMLYPTTLLGTLYSLNSFGDKKLAIALIITVFGISMLTDVFANVFGLAYHRGRYANQVSPKKSMSGAIFGLVGGLLFAGIMFAIVRFTSIFGDAFTELGLRNTILFFACSGLFGSLMTEFGDLVASAVKRNSGIKDFGKIFPGHGGMMDRVDGLMFCSSVVYVLAMILII